MINGGERAAGPMILAPAGDRESFLAAVAAGADAVYCGLKQYSARMAARNFTFDELAALTALAHRKGVRVYLAFNTVIKPSELDGVAEMLVQVDEQIRPDALIVQDLAVIELARQIGMKSELHLSTLANVSFPMALKTLARYPGVRKVVLPRELNVDEIRQMASARSGVVAVEVFVHGALCYGVSGRCYWSSYMGGKSGLRGRCVQPCRRRYRAAGGEERYFSCLDLSLDVLVKVLLAIPGIEAWKIEGRKKGPHYVYYTVSAYKMLRDHVGDPQMKKAALELLSLALGRVNTHYGFLPQRPQNPVRSEDHTGSGRLVGHVQGPADRPCLVTREELMPGDVLRVGYEDDAWHRVKKLNQYVPPRGRIVLAAGKPRHKIKGTPVFLIDRKEPRLKELMAALEAEMTDVGGDRGKRGAFRLKTVRYKGKKMPPFDLRVSRSFKAGGKGAESGLWLSAQALKSCPDRWIAGIWWWTPPVIWPGSEAETAALIAAAIKRGGRNFVLNAPWQTAFFEAPSRLNLWAGPFCNMTNGLAITVLKSLGFSGAIASPELGGKDFLELPGQSPLPLGAVLTGNWPLCVSRTKAESIAIGGPFVSPRGEAGWVAKHGGDYWVFPNWEVDLSKKREALSEAGYRCFVHLLEPVPSKVVMKKRPGLWNWEVGLR